MSETTKRPNPPFDVFRFADAPQHRPPMSYVLRDVTTGDVYVHSGLIGSPAKVLALAGFDGEPLARRGLDVYVRTRFVRQCRPALADTIAEIERQVAAALVAEGGP